MNKRHIGKLPATLPRIRPHFGRKTFLAIFLLSLFFLGNPSILAQEEKAEKPRNVTDRKGHWSIQWGYNRDSYTQSDINFRGPGYRFTLHSVDAKDKPERLSTVYINPGEYDIPQFNLKFSYYFSDHLFITFGEDHMKYVMARGQPVHYYGYIDPLAIAKNRTSVAPDSIGVTYFDPNNANQMAGYHGGNQTIQLTPDILKFEHTDGLNFLFFDIGWIVPVWTAGDGSIAFSMVGSAGAGPVVCRTDVRLWGKGQNDNFHIAGYGVSGYVGTRLDLSRRYFVEFGAKGGYMDLLDIFTSGGSNRASQNFGFLEVMFTGGVML